MRDFFQKKHPELVLLGFHLQVIALVWVQFGIPSSQMTHKAVAITLVICGVLTFLMTWISPLKVVAVTLITISLLFDNWWFASFILLWIPIRILVNPNALSVAWLHWWSVALLLLWSFGSTSAVIFGMAWGSSAWIVTQTCLIILLSILFVTRNIVSPYYWGILWGGHGLFLLQQTSLQWMFAVPYSMLVLWLLFQKQAPDRDPLDPQGLPPNWGRAFLWAMVPMSVTGSFLEDVRYFPERESAQTILSQQPDVEQLTYLETKAPKFRMELTCDPLSKTYVVSPHRPSENTLFAYSDGRQITHDFNGEGSDHSVFQGGFWYTIVDGALVKMTLDPLEVVSRLPITTSNGYHLNYDASNHHITFTEDESPLCFGVSLKTDQLEYQFEGAGTLGAECVRHENSLWHTSLRAYVIQAISRRNFRNNRIEAFQQFLNPSPYQQLELDHTHQEIYVPLYFRGKIAVLDLESLELKRWVLAETGVRGVLLPNEESSVLYSWNYSKGTIIEYDRIRGTEKRRWNVGPVLRTVNFDCQQKALLAATRWGLFKIHL